MRESIVERKLSDEVKKRGGLALKFISPGFDGVPDRIVILPDGYIAFVETKAPKKVMRPLQLRVKQKLEKLGCRVYCVDCKEKIGGILDDRQTS